MLVVLTFKELQPMLLFSVNEGSGTGWIQTVLVTVSFPQPFALVLAIIEISYVPGAENWIPNVLDPQVKGLLFGFGLPKLPFTTVQPIFGEISQLFKVLSLQVPKASTTAPLIVVFVKFTVVFTQVIVSGEIINSAIGDIPEVMGAWNDAEKPQGFSINNSTTNAFSPAAAIPLVAPQDVVVNTWV